MLTRKDWLEVKILESLKSGEPRTRRGISNAVDRNIGSLGRHFTAMVRDGQIERVSRGVYRIKRKCNQSGQ